ncbi:MAG TPA: exonuclease domain-containing protein [Candidatus Aquicultor sp.]|jgi:DNA polymerase-3 subunit epsilon
MAAREVSRETPLDEATYVVVDLETTGLDPRTEHIIEIGAVKMIGSQPVETFNRLVNPNRMIPPKITALTGITNGMLADALELEKAFGQFAEFAKDSVLVAHNAPFDLSFLNRAARSIGHKSFRSRYFDTLLIARKLKPMLGFYRLENLVVHFGAAAQPCHRALPDALATAEVFSSLIGLMKDKGLSTVDRAGDFFYPRIRHNFTYKKALAAALPNTSGVYLMKNRSGDVVYVGKAKDINKRVRSYFYAGPKTERQLALLEEIHAIDHIKTGTEIGALLLESKLIKVFKPPYNVLGKRYRRYPFVHINFDDEFPAPHIVKKITDKGFHYGPFSNTADVELLLQVIKDMYALKQCSNQLRPGMHKQPCFYYEVNRCMGVCSGTVSKDEYLRRLAAVTGAFEGRPEQLQSELIRRRNIASERLLFERAALLNRALESLERTVKLLDGIKNARANLDFLLIENLEGATKLYLVEEGQLRSCIDFKGRKRDISRLERKIEKIYFERKTRPAEITPEQIENLSLLTSYFHKRRVARIKIGSSPDKTLRSVLDTLQATPPAPSTEKVVCSSFRLQS